MTKTAILLFAVILPAAAPDSAGELSKHVPAMEEVQEGEFRFEYEPAAVTLREARQIVKEIRRKNPDEHLLEIFGMPGVTSYFLVTAGGNQTETDYGWRFLLLRKQEEGFQRVFRGHGAADSYILRPIFFIGKDRILIFGEQGTEYTWGFSVLEFRVGENTLKRIGYLNVAQPLDDPWGSYSNPFDRGRVFFRDGRYVVEFASDLILYPGQEKETLLENHGEPIRFHHDGEDFVLEKTDRE